MDKATRARLKAAAASSKDAPRPPVPRTLPVVSALTGRNEQPPVMSMAEAILTAPKRKPETAKKAKDAAPPIKGMAGELGASSHSCCCCLGLLNAGDMVTQTKKLKWRHVQCPPRPPKAPKQRQPKHGMGRLPHRSVFHANYDSAHQEWTGRLEIPASDDVNSGWRIFHDEASGVMKLLERLDGQYRQYLAKAGVASAAVDA